MAALLEPDHGPENDLLEQAEVELSSDQDQTIATFSSDAFAHALSGASVSENLF